MGSAAEELALSSERRGDSLVVSIRGDLDLVSGRQFDGYLTRARAEHDRIVLDMSGVDFLDTSSLAVIVGHWKAMQAAGGTLSLAGARYRYTKSLWITGLADRLPFYDTVDKAVAAGPADASHEDASQEDASHEDASHEDASHEDVSQEESSA